MMIDELKRKNTDPYITLTEEEILKKLENSRTHANEGYLRDADDVARVEAFRIAYVYIRESFAGLL